MSKASKKNPSLEPLSILAGEWETTGKHPMLPGVILHGRTTFTWIENGAFLMMKNHIDHKDFPDGIALFGSDGSSEDYTMLYFDERGISRKYASSLKNNTWNWWREDKEFSQRFTGEIKEDGNTIISKGEMSRDGKRWEKDLELTYTRVKVTE